MPHLFQPYADTVARTVLLAILVGPFLAIGAAYWIVRFANTRPTKRSRSISRCRSATSITSAGWGSIAAIATPQSRHPPVAGLPPTHTCMTCHSQLYTQTAMLAPVRESLADNKPIHWNKVNGCPITSISITRSTSPKASAAPPVTARSPPCR